MRIHGNKPEVTQPKQGPQSVPSQVQPSVQEQQPSSPRARHDHVQISDAGRAKAAEASDASSAAGLDPQRASDIRRKVLEGAYNSVNVVDTVARRILERGDV